MRSSDRSESNPASPAAARSAVPAGSASGGGVRPEAADGANDTRVAHARSTGPCVTSEGHLASAVAMTFIASTFSMACASPPSAALSDDTTSSRSIASMSITEHIDLNESEKLFTVSLAYSSPRSPSTHALFTSSAADAGARLSAPPSNAAASRANLVAEHLLAGL